MRGWAWLWEWAGVTSAFPCGWCGLADRDGHLPEAGFSSNAEELLQKRRLVGFSSWALGLCIVTESPGDSETHRSVRSLRGRRLASRPRGMYTSWSCRTGAQGC